MAEPVTSQDRVVIVISSDDDDNNDQRSIYSITSTSSDENDITQPTSVFSTIDVNQLQTSLADTIPIHLVPPHISKYLSQRSNLRLQEVAMSQPEATLDDIFIGPDCVVTWEDMTWDPELSDLHTEIQNQLVDHQMVMELGKSLRSMVVDLGNQKLRAAAEMGYSIKDIIIGPDLLPRILVPEEKDQDAAGNDLDTLSENVDPPPALNSPLPEEPRGSEIRHSTESSSSNSNSNTDEDEDIDPDDSSNNLANNPLMDNYNDALLEDDERHILHDVDVVLSGEEISGMDFSVFMADDSDDLPSDMPEIEMAIDASEWNDIYNGVDSVDVEIDGIWCNSAAATANADDDMEEEPMTEVGYETDMGDLVVE